MTNPIASQKRKYLHLQFDEFGNIVRVNVTLNPIEKLSSHLSNSLSPEKIIADNRISYELTSGNIAKELQTLGFEFIGAGIDRATFGNEKYVIKIEYNSQF